MALDCTSKLTADIEKDCLNKPQAGIEVNAVLINFDDIDRTLSVIDATNPLLLTNLALNSPETGFSLEGIKQVQGISYELVLKEDSFDGFKHTFSGVILSPTVANKESLDEMNNGSRFVVVVEKKYKGAVKAEAFEVLGWDNGLVKTEETYNSKESDGVTKFTLSSPDGMEEGFAPRTLLETDYATTKTAFDAKFG